MPAYYRRGLQFNRTSYLPAPLGGWNPDANWWELPDNQAPVLDNFLLRPGKIVGRGPWIQIANPNSPATVAVGFNFGDVAAGSSSPSGVMNMWCKVDDTTHYIDPWTAPLVNAPAANLAQANVQQAQVALDTGATVLHTDASRDVVGGPRWINFNGLLYGISYDASAAAVHDANSVYNIPPLNLLTMPVLQTPSGFNGGTRLVTTGADSAAVGTVAWTSPNNITLANETTPASAALGGGLSHYLTAVFGAGAVPGGATITGVQFMIDAQAPGGGAATDASVKLLKAGTPTGTDHGDPSNRSLPGTWLTGAGSPPFSFTRSYGGPNDLWGTSLVPADVNAANFGVAFSFLDQSTNTTVQVAGIWMIVYYTVDNTSVATVVANAPHGAFDLKGYLSRVWLLGGVDTPGALTVHEPNTLFYTNPIGTPGAGSPLGSNTADWKDPVTGNGNKLTMDVNNDDFGVGLGLVTNAMLIFRRNSVWRLTGTTSNSFVLKPMSREVGCIDARSIVENDKGIFWLSARGLMFTDGTSIKNVSGSVAIDLVAAINQSQTTMLQATVNNKGVAYGTAALTTQGQVMVTVGSASSIDNAHPAVYSAAWAGMYDPASGAWTRHTSNLLTLPHLPVLLVAHSVRQQLYAVGNPTFGGNPIIQLENYSYADAAVWGTSFLNASSGSNNALEDVDKTTLTLFSEFPRTRIPYVWATKLSPFDVSHKGGLIRRYFIDHTLAQQAGVSTVFGGVTVQLTSVTAPTNLDALQTLPPSAQTGGQFVVGGGPQRYVNPQITRKDFEASAELRDSYFVFQSTLSALSGSHFGINSQGVGPGLLEFYGVGFDYTITRDSEGTGGS